MQLIPLLILSTVSASSITSGGPSRPFVRGIRKSADTLGKTNFDIAMTPSMSGTTRYYQAILHDAGQSDGTGTALSNAIEVIFCD